MVDSDPKTDPPFASLLLALSHAARKSTKIVLHSLFQWQIMVRDSPTDAESVRRSLSGRPSMYGQSATIKEVSLILAKQKDHISLFLLARALTAIAPVLEKGSLTAAERSEFESKVFVMLKNSAAGLTGGQSVQALCFQAITELLSELSRSK